MFLCNAGAGWAQPTTVLGPDGDIMLGAWIKPDLDLSHYERVLLFPTAIQFREVRRQARSARAADNEESFRVSDSMSRRLTDTFGEAFHETFSGIREYEVTSEPGRNVLMIQGLLTDVMSGVPPDRPGSNINTLDWVWEANIILEVRDSMSGEVLARTVDRQRVDGPVRADMVLGLAPRIMDDWARLLYRRLDEVSDLGGHPDVPGRPTGRR